MNDREEILVYDHYDGRMYRVSPQQLLGALKGAAQKVAPSTTAAIGEKVGSTKDKIKNRKSLDEKLAGLLKGSPKAQGQSKAQPKKKSKPQVAAPRRGGAPGGAKGRPAPAAQAPQAQQAGAEGIQTHWSSVLNDPTYNPVDYETVEVVSGALMDYFPEGNRIDMAKEDWQINLGDMSIGIVDESGWVDWYDANDFFKSEEGEMQTDKPSAILPPSVVTPSFSEKKKPKPPGFMPRMPGQRRRVR